MMLLYRRFHQGKTHMLRASSCHWTTYFKLWRKKLEGGSIMGAYMLFSHVRNEMIRSVPQCRFALMINIVTFIQNSGHIFQKAGLIWKSIETDQAAEPRDRLVSWNFRSDRVAPSTGNLRSLILHFYLCCKTIGTRELSRWLCIPALHIPISVTYFTVWFVWW
jgi:hypothetical protein